MRQILSLAVSAILPLMVYAQGMLPNDIPSPNASDLGRFGDIPVSYYTGRPDVSIPLYELTVRGVTLPITLSYDASGVLVNSLPGWTGHNWTLNAGGCITRTINYMPDEYVFPFETGFPLSERNKNYFNSCRMLSHDRFSSGPFGNYSWLRDSIIFHRYDLCADVFHFNAMGLTGRFFMGNDGEWKVQSDKNVEVVFDPSDAGNYILPFIDHGPYIDGDTPWVLPKTIKGFILRDENGTKYYFGGTTDCIEYTTNFLCMTSGERTFSWNAVSWYLKKVEDRFGNVLFQFSYERGYFIAHLFNGGKNLHVSGQDFLSDHLGLGIPYGGSIIAPVYLTKINTADNRQIVFSSENFPTSMLGYYDVIRQNYQSISDALCLPIIGYIPFFYLQTDDAQIKPYQFNADSQNKMTDPLYSCCLRKLTGISLGTTYSAVSRYDFEYSYNSRMHLTELRFHKSGSYADVSRFSFRYNNFHLLPSAYQTKAYDHWGFYNGIEYTFPTSVYGMTTFSQKKEPNTTYAKYGMLERIIYPTGGMSEFEFEHNRYTSYQSEDRTSMIASAGVAGGFRIKSISNYEDSTKAILLGRRSFTYTNPDNGQESGQLYAKPRYYWQSWKPQCDSNGNTINMSFFKTYSIIPLANTSGSHIGYSYVTESDLTGRSTVYHYQNLSDALDLPMVVRFSDGPSPYDIYCDRSYMRGKLLSVASYEGSSLRKQTTYTYRDSLDTQQKYVLTGDLTTWGAGETGYIQSGVGKLFYSRYDVASEQTTVYEPGSNVAFSYTRNYQKNDMTLYVTYGNHTHPVDVRMLQSENLVQNGEVKKSVSYDYTYSFVTQPYTDLAKKQFCLLPFKRSETTRSNTRYHVTSFFQTDGMIVPRHEIEYETSSKKDTLVTYIEYTSTGQPKKFKEMGKPVTTLTWTGNDCHLQSKTVNSQTTSYSYNYNYKVTSITQPNGNKTYYRYDFADRLTEILDKNNKRMKLFNYHYKDR